MFATAATLLLAGPESSILSRMPPCRKQAMIRSAERRAYGVGISAASSLLHTSHSLIRLSPSSPILGSAERAPSSKARRRASTERTSREFTSSAIVPRLRTGASRKIGRSSGRRWCTASRASILPVERSSSTLAAMLSPTPSILRSSPRSLIERSGSARSSMLREALRYELERHLSPLISMARASSQNLSAASWFSTLLAMRVAPFRANVHRRHLRLMRAAVAPAPMPLSMFTTVRPGEHDCSMDTSAAFPSPPAP